MWWVFGLVGFFLINMPAANSMLLYCLVAQGQKGLSPSSRRGMEEDGGALLRAQAGCV